MEDQEKCKEIQKKDAEVKLALENKEISEEED